MVSVDVNVEEEDLHEALEDAKDADGGGEIIDLGVDESGGCDPRRVAPDPGSPTEGGERGPPDRPPALQVLV